MLGSTSPHTRKALPVPPWVSDGPLVHTLLTPRSSSRPVADLEQVGALRVGGGVDALHRHRPRRISSAPLPPRYPCRGGRGTLHLGGPPETPDSLGGALHPPHLPHPITAPGVGQGEENPGPAFGYPSEGDVPLWAVQP